MTQNELLEFQNKLKEDDNVAVCVLALVNKDGQMNRIIHVKDGPAAIYYQGLGLLDMIRHVMESNAIEADRAINQN